MGGPPPGGRGVLRVPWEGGGAELVSPAIITTDGAAFAPDGTLWYSEDDQVGKVVGDSLIVRHRGRQFRLLQVLADGRTALGIRTRLGNTGGPVVLLDLDTGGETMLLATPMVEARVARGLLVTVTNGGLLQVTPLDRSGRRLRSGPVTVASNVAVTGQSVAEFAVADNGNVAYIPQEPASLVLVDRSGASRMAIDERRNFHAPMFSPDGRRLSLDFTSVEGRNVWILSLRSGWARRDVDARRSLPQLHRAGGASRRRDPPAAPKAPRERRATGHAAQQPPALLQRRVAPGRQRHGHHRLQLAA